MHIYFCGIGAGTGPLALLAARSGWEVSGSDKQDHEYLHYLSKHGITNIHIGQTADAIAALHQKKPIDWLVYSSAVPREQPDHPELAFATKNGIKTTKRDELLKLLLQQHHLKLIAIAGTHGKTTTTAMVIWMFKRLGMPVSYLVGAKLSFGEMAELDDKAQYFVYEADEYDRNFLSFTPEVAIIPGIDYDHPDIYPTRADYNQAFCKFIRQSTRVFAHADDLQRIGMPAKPNTASTGVFSLAGEVNRKNALLVIDAMSSITTISRSELIEHINTFPGVSRRFEKIAKNIYSDYAHTPEKIRGALQLAHERAGGDVVVVYEGLHNTRQHFIRDELPQLFAGSKRVYIVPSYLAREDESLELLTPQKLAVLVTEPAEQVPSALNSELKQAIAHHAASGDLVLCLSAGGGNSLDEWLRNQQFDQR